MLTEIYQHLITTCIGLGILASGYLCHLLTGVARVAFTPELKWSWKKMLEGLVKAGLWGVAILLWVVVCDGVNWFAKRMGADIEAILDGASVAGLVGGLIGGTVYYVGKSFKNIIDFVNTNHTEVKVNNPDYKGVADAVEDIFDTMLGRSVKEALEEEDLPELEGEDVEPGKGAYYPANTYPEPYRSAAQDSMTDPSTCYNREAQPAGTLITMADGSYKEVENIKVGDLLWNHNGTGLVKVKSLWQEEKPVYTISTGLGNIRFTGEHPIYARQNKWKILPRGDKKAYGKPKFVKTKELHVGDKVFIPEIEGERLDLSKNELRWLGFYLGDGTKSEKTDKCPIYRLCVADGRKRKYVDSLGIDGTYSKHSSSDNANFFTLSKKSSPNLRKVLDSFSGKSFNLLTIPEQAKYIVEGYLEADGCKIKDDVYSASSTDKKLLLAIQRMVLSIGGTMSIHKRYDSQELEKFGTRVYAKTLWEANVNLSPHRKMVHEFDDGKYATITSISHGAATAKVYNIEVSGSHTYIAENIGVHNCVSYCAWKIKEIRGSWPARTGSMSAKYWVDRLPSWGYKKVSSPKDGGKYVGVSTAGTYGHVVWFEGGNMVSEYNYSTRGGFGVRNVNLSQYIWYEIKAPTPAPKPTPAPTPAPTPKPTPAPSSVIKAGDSVIAWGQGTATSLGTGAKTKNFKQTKMKVIMVVNGRYALNQYNKGSVGNAAAVTGWWPKSQISK